jgi:hypothetical protein
MNGVAGYGGEESFQVHQSLSQEQKNRLLQN